MINRLLFALLLFPLSLLAQNIVHQTGTSIQPFNPTILKKVTNISTWLFIFLTSISYQLVGQFTDDIQGKWDLEIEKDGKQLPAWIEIRKSGRKPLAALVYAFGDLRPITEVKTKDQKFSISIPPQWEGGNMDMVFEGWMAEDGLIGTMRDTDGKFYPWSAVLNPKWAYYKNPTWGEPISLFNGKDLSGWKATGDNQWVVEDGVLKSPKSGSNLVSEEIFTDFKLHIEFRFPKGSNSGISLRGRHKVQIKDKDPGEWQQVDITLIGRRMTIAANGIPVSIDQSKLCNTGGALDSKEGESGPFFIQGDHGPSEYRNIIVTPRVDEPKIPHH